jgi:hypothetical protein
LQLILSTSQKISTFLIDKNYIGAKMKWTSKKKKKLKTITFVVYVSKMLQRLVPT